MLRINDNVLVETEYLGCNVGCVLTERGPVLVDSPVLPQDIRNLLGELSQVSLMDIAYLVYTHEHFDHLIGSAHLTRRIIAHQASVGEIRRLKTGLPEEVKRYFPDIYRKYNQVFDSVDIILPEVVFDGKLELIMGNRTLILFYAGGHSKGSLGIYIPEDKVLFAGDNIVTGMPLVTPDSSFREWIDFLRNVEKMDIKTIIPGHGMICGKETASKTLTYFETVRYRVGNLIKAGVGREEIMNVMNLTDCLPVPLDKTNTQSMESTITAMYNQLITEIIEP